FVFFFQAEDGIRDFHVTGVQTCALPILHLLGGKYVNDPIRPEQSGTPEAPIRYRAYGDGEPVLTSDEPRGLEIAIDLRNRSHIRDRKRVGEGNREGLDDAPGMSNERRSG